MNMRASMVRLHRWAGLTIAGFLIVVGLTGGLLAFFTELNHLLTPRLFPAPRPGAQLDLAALASRAEALVPNARVNSASLGFEGTTMISMEPRPGAASLDFNQLFLDPHTGEELGRRMAGEFPPHLDTIIPFVFRLHFALALGETGAWVLGIVALIWTVDCFVAFYLTLPLPYRGVARSYFAKWKLSWLVKTNGSFYRLNFDLHRAGGLWLWAMLLIFAWSSVHFNMNEFYRRATNLLFDYRTPGWTVEPPQTEAEAPMGWEAALGVATRIMDERAQADTFTIDRPVSISLLREQGLYLYTVHSSRDIGDRFGSTTIAFDASTGAFESASLPTGERLGNTFTTWLVELHMANVFGPAYRIFVSALGLAIVMLSATGVYIWWRKRVARLHHLRDRVSADVRRAGSPAARPKVVIRFGPR